MIAATRGLCEQYCTPRPVLTAAVAELSQDLNRHIQRQPPATASDQVLSEIHLTISLTVAAQAGERLAVFAAFAS